MESIDNSNINGKIFVGNVPFQCTREEFSECFKHLEGYVDADIVNKFNTNNSRGFGFVKFNTQERANEFLSSKIQIVLKDRVLRFTNYTQPIKQMKNYKNYIFVKNIPLDMTVTKLKTEFSKFGDIGICYINTNNVTGESKETGVIEILDSETFENLLQVNEVNIDGKILKLTRWKPKLKFKKTMQTNTNLNTNTNVPQMDVQDIYRVAFNAGRNMGILEGIKIGKKDE
jgi:RNA recognition motif-containing protein